MEEGLPTTYTINVKKSFEYKNGAEEQMMVQVARICVVYQNFMLEVSEVLNSYRSRATHAETYRTTYFGFRVLASVWEMKQAVDVLNRNSAFKARRQRFERRIEEIWDRAVKFFQANQQELKKYRNDYAGHITNDVAKFGIDNMPPALTGQIIVTMKPAGSVVELAFAGQILAVGMTKHRPDGQAYEMFMKSMLGLIADAQNHALDVGHIIAQEFFI